MNENISKLLSAGLTPEAIYQEALKAAQEQKQEEAKTREIEKARKTMLDALKDYVDLVMDGNADEDMIKALESDFTDLEKIVIKLKKSDPEVKNEKKCNCKRPLTDEEKLTRFLRDICAY